MAGTTSVPSIQFTAAGIVLPAESDVLSGAQSDMNAAFGGSLNPALNTPQGQLASSLSAVVGNKNNEIAAFVNGVDPATASGAMQDAIGRIYFMDRVPASATVVQVLCTGLAGVVIPFAALVVDTAGVVYGCTGTGTISIGGSITLTFEAVATGPVVCASNSISIYKAIAGWDSASNPLPGVTGRLVESRADFEYRRKQSVAINAVGTLPSIYAAVFVVPGVLDVFALDNPLDTVVTIGTITMPKHSIYVAAVGGTDLDVATAIWKKKSSGANMTGNTTVNVSDSSGYQAPLPTYAIKFQRPAALPILFAVQIANSASLPSNIIALVQAAIINAFNGGDGGPRARIGSAIYASRFYAPVSQVAALGIISILIGTTTATLNSLTVDIGSAPTVTTANISVTLV